MSTHKLTCPHCGKGMRIRNSRALHPLMRVNYVQCMNVACGWIGRGVFEVTHQMSPSAMPNPEIKLPLADSAMRAQAMEKDNERQQELAL